MTTRSGPQLQDTYNIILITNFISPVGVQNRDLVQKIPVGTLQDITDFLCFLLVHFSVSYHINVCICHIIRIDNI